jgi:hypothetical protein
MKIDDDHQYLGAALAQIAEDPQFTAINSLTVNGTAVRGAYKINHEIATYMKYASKPTPSHGEYQFTFNARHIADLKKIAAANEKTYIILVCVKVREICCITYEEFNRLISRRIVANGANEPQYTVLVTAKDGAKMRAYVNVPGKRNKILGDALKVTRSAFPSAIFA